MDKQAPGVEWQVAKDEVEWEDFCAPPIPNQGPPVQRRWHRQRSRWTVALLALFLVGGWWWHMAQTDRLQAGVAERTRKAVEPNAVTQSDDPVTLYGQRHSVEQAVSLRAAIQTSEPDNPFDLGVDTVEVQGDQAVARIVTTAKDGAPAYRQTRFYRRTDAGWVRTDPDAVLMGSARSLETPCCVFHFRQNDASAVIAVAPRVDGLSTAIRHNFGLTSTPGGMKLVIEVSVTQPPGQALSWYDVPDRFIVPSPVLYRAPVELTDVDLLAQSIAFPLLNAMLAQASELYGIDSAWQPIVRGLYLWQVWEMDLPLSAWREDLVTWTYAERPLNSPGQTNVLPDQYEEICAAHALWMPSPYQLDIPLLCNELDRENPAQVWGRAWDLRMRLDQLGVPLPRAWVKEPFLADYPLGQTVVLATLIEYTVATYGRERLPMLMAGMGQYQSWDTLLPAVYGVSPAEFEVGWQAYLAAHYGR